MTGMRRKEIAQAVPKYGVTMRKSIGLFLAGAALLTFAVPAHAAGGLGGSGSVTIGCTGGQVGVGATNSSGNNWVFNVTVWCPTAVSQNVTVAGNWDAGLGGVVVGFGTGSLQIGRVLCGSNSGVTVQAAMIGSPLVTAKANITRVCL